jgi:hypothetical protein
MTRSVADPQERPRRDLCLPAAIVVGASLAALAAGVSPAAGADTWEPTPPPPFPGSAPPAGHDTARTVVSNLQSSGYKVILNRVGGAPLDQCTVTSVTPGEPVTQLASAGGGSMNSQVLFTTIFVTADCNHRGKPSS